MIVGAVLVALTVVIHALAQEKLILLLEWLAPILGRYCRPWWKVITSIVAVSGIMLAIITEIWLWAVFFFYMTTEPSLHTLESALYFSTSTFTSLGLGDITLSHAWRLLSSFEAANGLLIFGWSTAFLFEIVSNLYRNDRIQPS